MLRDFLLRNLASSESDPGGVRGKVIITFAQLIPAANQKTFGIAFVSKNYLA